MSKIQFTIFPHKPLPLLATLSWSLVSPSSLSSRFDICCQSLNSVDFSPETLAHLFSQCNICNAPKVLFLLSSKTPSSRFGKYCCGPAVFPTTSLSLLQSVFPSADRISFLKTNLCSFHGQTSLVAPCRIEDKIATYRGWLTKACLWC